MLICRYPALRVAYIEEKEEIVGDKPQKVYSSILAKAVGNFDQVLNHCWQKLKWLKHYKVDDLKKFSFVILGGPNLKIIFNFF